MSVFSGRDTTARLAVRNILSGLTAEGLSPFPLAIPFTSNQAARDAVSDALRFILFHVPSLAAPHLTPLTAKLLIHFNKTGRQDADAIAEFMNDNWASLVAALTENPGILLTKASIGAIIRKQVAAKHQGLARQKRTLPAGLPPRTVLWSEAGYRIEETTDPRHLRLDSFAIGHCAGSTYNDDALERLGITENSPDAIHYLSYWMAIRTRRARILTLTSNGVPLVTMEYRVRDRALRQVVANQPMTGDEHFFKPLCRGLAALRPLLRYSSIPYLVLPAKPHAGHVLTSDGQQRPPTFHNIPCALGGSIIATPENTDIVVLACTNPLLDIDITHTDQTGVDAISSVAGSLTFFDVELHMPNLTEIGHNLEMCVTYFCSMPELRRIGGDLVAEGLFWASFPRLTTVCGEFEAPDLVHADLSGLHSVRGSEKTAHSIWTRHHKPMAELSLQLS
jgi:hypothetical protein